MLRNIFACGAVLVLAASAQAGVIISESSSATVGLSGFTTYTLAASTDDGSDIVGFDFASQPTYGFFGAMNQINPAGQPTIFTDANSFFPFVPGSDVSQDSQFKYASSAVVVPAGFAEEGANKLRAVFASANSLGQSNVSFVQLAIPNAAAGLVNYLGTVTTSKGGVFADVPVSGQVPNIPEPASIALLGLAVAGLVGVRRR